MNSKHKTLIIIGAGGHGRVVADCAEQLNHYEHIYFLDDCFDERKNNAHWQIMGQVNCWQAYLSSADFIVAFGNNVLRLSTLKLLKQADANVIHLIHPAAIVSQYSHIGEGTVVFAGAVINVGSDIGQGCIINTQASIDHDCVLADGVHISPNVALAGGVSVGINAWLGIGSTVIQGINISNNCQTGAGTVVIRHLEEAGLYVGNPARLIKSYEESNNA